MLCSHTVLNQKRKLPKNVRDERSEKIKGTNVYNSQINHLQHSLAIEVEMVPAWPRIEYWLLKIEAVVCAALAAAEQEERT
jgi:hypothetical protein